MKLTTVFCPRGCNVFDTTEKYPECGACGSGMTDDPASFDDAIEEIEERGIAEVERKLKCEPC